MAELLEPLISALWFLLSGFWSAGIAVVLSAAGIILRRPAWLIAGTLLSLPFSLYTLAGPLLLLFPIYAALMVRLRATWAAWLFLLPFAGFFAWFFALWLASLR